MSLNPKSIGTKRTKMVGPRERYLYRRFDNREFKSLQVSWLFTDKSKAVAGARRFHKLNHLTRITDEDGKHRLWIGPWIQGLGKEVGWSPRIVDLSGPEIRRRAFGRPKGTQRRRRGVI